MRAISNIAPSLPRGPLSISVMQQRDYRALPDARRRVCRRSSIGSSISRSSRDRNDLAVRAADRKTFYDLGPGRFRVDSASHESTPLNYLPGKWRRRQKEQEEQRIRSIPHCARGARDRGPARYVVGPHRISSMRARKGNEEKAVPLFFFFFRRNNYTAVVGERCEKKKKTSRLDVKLM